MKLLQFKPFVLACLASYIAPSTVYADISSQQLPYSADPYQKWQNWQDAGAATIWTPELRDGNVYYLSPAEVIYYSAMENSLNPLLLLVKLQAEQSLIERPYVQPELARRLERAVGYGYLDSNPSTSKWPGFYPQLVAMSYEFTTMRLKMNFHDAFIEYTPSEIKYTELVGIYAKYAEKMNAIAKKKYAVNPTSFGYLNDFRDITPAHIQAFLTAYSGPLSNKTLFPHDGEKVPKAKAQISAMPKVPTQMQANGTLKFSVTTNKPATKVSILFTNPDAERTLTGSGTNWRFNQTISVPNNRTWSLRVYVDNEITDERFGGNINVLGDTAPDSLADWQKLNVEYALAQNALYASTPLTDVYGNNCGDYTYCFAWARHAPGSPLAGGMGDAYNAFIHLKNTNQATEDNNFAHAPIGAIVFYQNGEYGHAAIKVDETHIISQGQLDGHDCTISNVEWDKISDYVGYYAPAPDTTIAPDANIIPKAEQVSRGTFLADLGEVLEVAVPDLPDDPIEKAVLMGLISDPENFDAKSPIIRQDAARILARAVKYFEDYKDWTFAKTGDSNQFANDPVIQADPNLYAVVVRMAEFGLFFGVLQEDGRRTFEGLRQLSITEKASLLLTRFPPILEAAKVTAPPYVKIANDGSELPYIAKLGSEAKDWACTYDKKTGLMWEIKTDDGGLRDKDNTYSWYNPSLAADPKHFIGYPNLGVCTGGISCDTDAFVLAVNAQGLCGHNDWRMPGRDELSTIINTKYKPTIDPKYFPVTYPWAFWSSSAGYGLGNKKYAYYVSFDGNWWSWYWTVKNAGLAVRVVRNVAK